MLKGLFKFVLAIAVAAIAAVGGINACVVLSANPAITTLDKYEQSRVASCDAIVVLGASVLPDGSLSPILQKRVDAAIDLYFRGVAPIVVMSGDGRESNYDEPNAMKAYAIAQGVPESAIYCDGAAITRMTPCGASRMYMARKAWPLSRRNTTNIARCLMRKAWVCQPLAW